MRSICRILSPYLRKRTDAQLSTFSADRGWKPTLRLAAVLLGLLSCTSFVGAQVLIYPENAVYFSPLPVGSTSPPQYVKIVNTDYSKTLTFSAITLSGSDFNFVNNCPKTLGPRASCKITVYFHPKATGDRSGYVAFSDNVSGGAAQGRGLIGLGKPAQGSVTVQETPVLVVLLTRAENCCA